MEIKLSRNGPFYPVQISISRIWHVIIDNNVNTFNVNSSTNQICSHENPLMSFLKTLVSSQPGTSSFHIVIDFMKDQPPSVNNK